MALPCFRGKDQGLNKEVCPLNFVELRVNFVDLRERIDNTICILPIFLNSVFWQSTPDMVFVQGGKFRMGSDLGVEDERQVYYIGKFEVTQAQWKRVMEQDTNKKFFEGCGNCPLIQKKIPEFDGECSPVLTVNLNSSFKLLNQ